MHVLLNFCVYCERNPDELVEEGIAENTEEALQYVKVAENQVLLCTECANDFTDMTEFDEDKDPVTFPPGVRSVEHTCPALQRAGEAPQWATFTIELLKKGDYRVAECQHCGMVIRSLAEDDI